MKSSRLSTMKVWSRRSLRNTTPFTATSNATASPCRSTRGRWLWRMRCIPQAGPNSLGSQNPSPRMPARCRGKWKDFWLFKEAFHSVRHAYAITAHRSQGSTYTTVLGDYKDVLVNRTRHEALRCFYVMCTRPTTSLVLA